MRSEIGDDPESQALADEAHRKSIVLLRNGNEETGTVLPITDEEASDVKLYVEVFEEDEEAAAKSSEGLKTPLDCAGRSSY